MQVLEYVGDPTAALAEIFRTLRPGGRLVVWDIDWATVSLHSGDPARTERVLRAWDEHLVHPSLPRTLGPRLRSAGFEEVRMEAHAFATSELDPETYGAALVPFAGAFVVGRNGITDEEARPGSPSNVSSASGGISTSRARSSASWRRSRSSRRRA